VLIDLTIDSLTMERSGNSGHDRNIPGQESRKCSAVTPRVFRFLLSRLETRFRIDYPISQPYGSINQGWEHVNDAWRARMDNLKAVSAAR